MSRLLPGQPVNVLRNVGAREQSPFSGFVADTGVKDIQAITFGAFAVFAQGDFFLVSNPAGYVFAIWFDLDAAGTEPNGDLYTAADAKIEVNIATGNTATQVAAAVQAAIVTALAAEDITTTNPSAGVVRFTQALLGVTDPIVDYLETELAGSPAITPAIVTAGVASNWQNKYILFSSGDTDYAAWANVATEGVDPEVADKTMVPVALSAAASAAAVLAAFVAAIDALSGLKSVPHDAGLQIVNEASGDTTDATAGNSPAVLGTIEQGTATNFALNPGDSPASLTNQPSLISS